MSHYVIYSCCYPYVKNTKCLVIVKQSTLQNICRNKLEMNMRNYFETYGIKMKTLNV